MGEGEQGWLGRDLSEWPDKPPLCQAEKGPHRGSLLFNSSGRQACSGCCVLETSHLMVALEDRRVPPRAAPSQTAGREPDFSRALQSVSKSASYDLEPGTTEQPAITDKKCPSVNIPQLSVC